MMSNNTLRWVSLTLIYMCLCYTFICISGSLGINMFNMNSLFAESLVTGNVTVCVKNGRQLFDEKTCRNRLHSNIDISHGLRYYHYVFRSKNNPSKGLYIIARTSQTTVEYQLDYKMTIPYYYREHTEGKTYAEVLFNPNDYCKKALHPSCTTNDKLPPGLDKIKKFCCICNVNISKETKRAKYKCDKKPNSIAMTYSCLETVEPWYNLYAVSYPPEVLKNTLFSVYRFDSSKGIVPDLKLYDFKDGYFDNYDIRANKKLDPSYKGDQQKSVLEETEESDHLKKEITKAAPEEEFGIRQKNNKLVPNFRSILIDSTAKEATIEDFDITITLLSTTTKDGSIPPMLDKYVAIPSFPRTNETVKGSSLMDKCSDSTWPKTLKCPEGADSTICKLWKCTINMRTVEKDAVDTTGNTCDKIGYSFKSHTEHRRLCEMKTSSCINRQLKWYLDQKGDEAKLPRFYGVDPVLALKTIKVPRTEDPKKERTTWFQEDRVHSINYVHSHDDVSRYKFDTFDATITEIVSDFPGFIVSTKIENECKINSSNVCTLKVNVKNMGNDAGDFTLRTVCYLDDTSKAKENIIANLDETTLTINSNEFKFFMIPIKLTGAISTDKSYCDTNLLSGTKKHLDNVKTPIRVVDLKPTVGTDPKILDPDVFTVPINVVPKQVSDPSDEKSVSGSKNSDKNNSECTCAKWNVFCMIINFRKCVISKLNKVFMYIMIALGVLLLIILLPVIIPFLSFITKSLVKVFKMPHDAMERRRIKKMRQVVTGTPKDLEGKMLDIGMNDTMASESKAIYPGLNVNVNLNETKTNSRVHKNSYEERPIPVDQQSVVSERLSARSRSNISKNGVTEL